MSTVVMPRRIPYSPGYLRPPEWCEQCSATAVRFTDAGEGLCWWCWLQLQIERFEAQIEALGMERPCDDPYAYRHILRLVMRSARPVDLDTLRIAMNVPPELVAELLAHIVAAGVLERRSTPEGLRWAWSPAASAVLPSNSCRFVEES